MEVAYSFGAWLKQRPKALDLTQAGLARQLGCATVTLQKIELDERRPSKEMAERLAVALEIPAEERTAFLRSARGELAIDRLAVETIVHGAPRSPWAAAPLQNLPVQRDPLIGRQREVAAVIALLQRPEVALLNLTGPGGTGKTRLALQVATDLLDQFADGVWLVELAPMHNAAQVPAAIAAVFDMTDTGGQPLIERLAAFLRPKQLLLVLDNFEQVLAAAPEVAHLLASAAGLKLLVTSRAVLHLAAEHHFPVSPLGLPDSSQPPGLAAVLQSDAVTLFLKRVQAVKPEFALTEATAPAVAEICARLDGLPLALELAAARSRLFAPEALLARLQPERARLQFLTGGARDTPARQQTIRNTIAWSYGLLSPAEQRLFRRQAVFVGGWTVEAAEAVCDAEGDLGLDVLEGLTALVEQSLVRQLEGPDGEPRFRRFETIREYAVEQLAASSEIALLRARHAAYFLRLAEEAVPAIYGPEQAAWLERLDVEYPNLRTALEWSCSGGAREDGLRLGAALAAFWHLRGQYREADQWLGRLLADRTGIAPAAQTKVLEAAGWMAFLVSDTARGRGLLEEAAALSHAVGDRRTYATALQRLAAFVSAMTYADAALAASQQLGDAMLVADAQFVIAIVRADQGRWEEARSVFEACAAEHRRRGDAIGVYETLLTLGVRMYRRGLYDEAEPCLAEALANVTRVGQGTGIAHCQLVLGQLAHARGMTTRAAALFAESLTGFRTSGHRHYIGAVLVWLSRVALAQGDDGEAQRRLDEGLALFRELDDHAGTARALWQAARLARHRDQFERATALLKEGLVLVRGTEIGHFEGDHIVQFEQVEGLAGLAAVEGAAVRAARLFGAAAAQRSMAGLVITPPDQEGYKRDIAAACAQLDDAMWGAAWAEGRAMTLEQAIAYALTDAGLA